MYRGTVRASNRLLLGIAASLVACGGAPVDSSALPYPATAISSNGSWHLVSTVSGGAPIVRGVHDVDVQVARTEDGGVASGLVLDCTPWMPAMGHGSPYDGEAAEVGEGHYRFQDVSLFMAGVWELRVALNPGGEHAVLAFDVH